MSDKHKKLEEDIAAFPYPVFGLRESVYDLEYVGHYEEEGRFTICYQSRSKPPYQLSGRSLWTFSLESSLYVHEGPLSVVHESLFNPYVEETNSRRDLPRRGEGGGGIMAFGGGDPVEPRSCCRWHSV